MAGNLVWYDAPRNIKTIWKIIVQLETQIYTSSVYDKSGESWASFSNARLSSLKHLSKLTVRSEQTMEIGRREQSKYFAIGHVYSGMLKSNKAENNIPIECNHTANCPKSTRNLK